MRDFDFSEYSTYGIEINGSEMDNGELRFRMSSPDSSYIRTETTKDGGWQNSHYHSEQREVFYIEKGSVLFATMENAEVKIKSYTAGDFFCIEPMIAHNMRMNPDTITHTIKCGGAPDWNAAPELDCYLRMEECDD